MNDKKRPPISVSKISITAKKNLLIQTPKNNAKKTIEFVSFLLKNIKYNWVRSVL